MRNYLILLTAIVLIVVSCSKSNYFSEGYGHDADFLQYELRGGSIGMTCDTNCLISGILDSDCDGVIDSLDICNGGVDTIDHNMDGLPDCAFPPAFEDIIDDWKCGKGDSTKVIICHVPPGNPANAHNICVSPNAIKAHIDHDNNNGNQNDDFSDYLGPCKEVCLDSTTTNPNPPTTGNLDADCDGVVDSLDVCPGGDDTIDNNNDGLADCAYPPSFSDIIASWKCGKGDSTKIIICHVPIGNPSNAKDICVSPNAISSHMDHGGQSLDYLGPCDEAFCP